MGQIDPHPQAKKGWEIEKSLFLKIEDLLKKINQWKKSLINEISIL